MILRSLLTEATLYMWHDTVVHVTWHSCTCDMTHLYLWHDTFVHLTWNIHEHTCTRNLLWVPCSLLCLLRICICLYVSKNLKSTFFFIFLQFSHNLKRCGWHDYKYSYCWKFSRYNNKRDRVCARLALRHIRYACCVVCCSVLQCVAVCCSVLQCVAVCCSVLQCAAVCCSVLQCVAVCCIVMQEVKKTESHSIAREKHVAAASIEPGIWISVIRVCAFVWKRTRANGEDEGVRK